MRTREELERLFGGPEALARIEDHVKANVDRMPPLTQRQKDALRVLLRPAPLHDEDIAVRTATAAPVTTGTAA